ncbi:hypothetical protein RCL1_002885 [Eukaryota sp. TZLM3-RCL]
MEAAPSADLQPIDPWTIIRSYFEEYGLVKQQIQSFDHFMDYDIREVIQEAEMIEITPTAQHRPGEQSLIPPQFQFRFKEPYLERTPVYLQQDGTEAHVLPEEARLRNLTYRTRLFLDVEKHEITHDGFANGEPQFSTKTELFNRVLIGQIPVMVKSKYCTLFYSDSKMTGGVECEYDQGGYFIMNGGEKAVIAQERMATNKIFVYDKGKKPNISHYAEIRSVPDNVTRSPAMLSIHLYSRDYKSGATARELERDTILNHTMVANIPGIREEIPIVVIFRALGIEDDKTILQFVVYSEEDNEMIELMQPSLVRASSLRTKEEALDFIGRRGLTVGAAYADRVRYAAEVLQRNFLPHVTAAFSRKRGESKVDHETRKDRASFRLKAYYFGYMVNRLLSVALNRDLPDDRDHYANKRVDMTGALLTGLFRNLFKKMCDDAKRRLEHMFDQKKELDLNAFRTAMNEKVITGGLNYALGTGNWDSTRESKQRTGVSQVLSRLTFMSAISNLRRINAPIQREEKLPKPRQLHNTHWGMICPAETPEGQSCGLLKNSALMSYVSTRVDSESVIKNLISLGEMELLSEISLNYFSASEVVKVFVNGNWVGVSKTPNDLVKTMKECRAHEVIDPMTSIAYDRNHKEIRFFTDGGRILRPLLTVTNGELTMSIHDYHNLLGNYFNDIQWADLLRNGFVEWLDTEEQQNAFISMSIPELLDSPPNIRKRFTHCEIHPSMILGVSASLIPFPDHNQSPRNTYQSAMGKQAMGIYASNFRKRMDTLANVLIYPQKPLVCTAAMEFLKFKELPAGQNAVVAIACYSGFNQEDSVIMNQSAVDRGLFRSMFFRSYKDTAKSNSSQGIVEEFERPPLDDCKNPRKGNYDKLEDDGLVPCGVFVSGEDMLIGKVSPISPDLIESIKGRRATKKDVSTPMRRTEEGFVDQVLYSTDQDGYKFTKVKIRMIRTPQVGDKFSSRHGQKGTVGILHRQADLPFTCDGIVPDIIINPHAIPSRMTIGQLVECLLGKVSSLTGAEGDGTPFEPTYTVKSISDRLHDSGYQRYGNEVMFNGFTGKKMDAHIFIGPTYYQRLKHMVEDKIHSRATGPVQILTRQPVEGRGREGGLRLGEMERDAIISHGAAAMLKDRLFFHSDAYKIYVCDLCGLMAVFNHNLKTFECKGCRNLQAISQINLPYACKLLFQELMSMFVAVRIRPN